MGIVVTRENPSAWIGRLAGDVRLWQDPVIAEHIGESWWLLARRGTEIVATWLVPVEITRDGPIARRSVRAMPYAAPRVTATHPKKRREIWRALIEFLQSECIGIELPLAPGVNDLGVFSQLGAFLEARQTSQYRLDGFDDLRFDFPR